VCGCGCVCLEGTCLGPARDACAHLFEEEEEGPILQVANGSELSSLSPVGCGGGHLADVQSPDTEDLRQHDDARTE
jgi:hypothetical protein